MTIHELKTDPEPFQSLWDGQKKAEVRRDDRGYQEGDLLTLKETRMTSTMAGVLRIEPIFTGRSIQARITHIQRGYGLPDGLVVLSLDVLSCMAPSTDDTGNVQTFKVL